MSELERVERGLGVGPEKSAPRYGGFGKLAPREVRGEVYLGQMRLVPELTATANPDGTIRIEIVPGHSLHLNETGTFLWEGLARGETPETLQRNLCEAFEVTPETAAADIERFLELLEENLLLER